jgi:hypothetical protein
MSSDNSNLSWNPLNKKRLSLIFKLGTGTNAISSTAIGERPDEQQPAERPVILDALQPAYNALPTPANQPAVSSPAPSSLDFSQIPERTQKRTPSLLRRARNLSRIFNGLPSSPTYDTGTNPSVPTPIANTSASVLLPSGGNTATGSLRSKHSCPVINESSVQQPSPSDSPSVPSVRIPSSQEDLETHPPSYLPPLRSTGSTTNPSGSSSVQQPSDSDILAKPTLVAPFSTSTGAPVPSAEDSRVDQPVQSCEDASGDMLHSLQSIHSRTCQATQRRKHDRRRSLDPMSLRTMMTSQFSVTSSSSFQPLQPEKEKLEKPKPRTLKRSRSLWQPKTTSIQENARLEVASNKRPSTAEPLSEKQRAMNVRRARKLNQVRLD